MIIIHPVEVKEKNRNKANNTSTLTYYDVRNLDKESLTFDWLEMSSSVLRFEESGTILVGPPSLIKTMVGGDIKSGVAACGIDLNSQIYAVIDNEVSSGTVQECICAGAEISNLDNIPTLKQEEFCSIESLPIALTTFTISGMTCQAAPNMTWEEWVNSNYNIVGIVIERDYIMMNEGFVSSNDGFVRTYDTIVSVPYFVSYVE